MENKKNSSHGSIKNTNKQTTRNSGHQVACRNAGYDDGMTKRKK